MDIAEEQIFPSLGPKAKPRVTHVVFRLESDTAGLPPKLEVILPELNRLKDLQFELNIAAVLAYAFLEGDKASYEQIIDFSRKDISKFKEWARDDASAPIARSAIYAPTPRLESAMYSNPLDVYILLSGGVVLTGFLYVYSIFYTAQKRAKTQENIAEKMFKFIDAIVTSDRDPNKAELPASVKREAIIGGLKVLGLIATIPPSTMTVLAKYGAAETKLSIGEQKVTPISWGRRDK
jgi:hypothetical protein